MSITAAVAVDVKVMNASLTQNQCLLCVTPLKRMLSYRESATAGRHRTEQ